MTRKKGFSLIELSIVILVIGVLIGGIYQGTTLYRRMKLEAAKWITKGSPVASVYGLSLWLDATSDEAFDSTPNNNDPIAKWKDSNPQKSGKNTANQTIDTLKPFYVNSEINGLPAIKCDGTDDLLLVTLGSEYFPTSAPSISNNFTIFIVAKPTTTHQVDAQSNSSTDGTSGQKYLMGAIQGGSQYGSGSIAGIGISLGINGISVYEHSNNYMPPLAVYNGSSGLSQAAIITIDYTNKTPTIFLNGASVQTGLTSTKEKVFPSPQICAGLYGAFSGSIGEIIVYDNRIAPNKRQQIEKYLGKKWGIKV